MKNLTLKVTMPIVLIIAVIAAIVYSVTIYPNSNQPRTTDKVQSGSTATEPPVNKDPRDEVVETYISLMEQEKYSEMRMLWPETNGGNKQYDPNEGYTPDDKIPQNQAERDFTPLYKYQHDSVVTYFGKDAWKNVNYELTKMPAPERETKWIEKSTGKEVSFEESVKINQEYWKKVLEENNWTEKDVFAPVGVKETSEEREKREKNYSKYIDGEPTKYTVEDSYERYAVDFSFMGNRIAKSGENEFRITITNKDGNWVVYDMLTWNPPISEHTGDI